MINDITTKEVLESVTDFLYPEEHEVYTVPIDLLPEKLNELFVLKQNTCLYDVNFSYERNAVLTREELEKELKRIISELPENIKIELKNEPENYIVACFLQKNSNE